MEMDKTWEAFSISRSFEKFREELLPDFFLKEEVNQHIKDNFRVVRKLLDHSYYEYQFYDVAALKAVLSFEMALRIRYKEVTGSDEKGISLRKLAHWFQSKNYFEVYNDKFLDNYRALRNSLAHPTSSNFSGILNREPILHAADLINALYESPKLRHYRKNIINTINSKLRELNKNGCLLKHGDKEYICFDTILCFVNNKLTPKELYFYIKPIFFIPENFLEEQPKIYDSPTYLIVGNEFRIYPDTVVITMQNEIYEISKLKSEIQTKQFDSWIKLFKTYSNQTGEWAYWKTAGLSELFKKHLRDFHLTISPI